MDFGLNGGSFSMKDSVASSVMTGTVDEFLNAFALFFAGEQCADIG